MQVAARRRASPQEGNGTRATPARSSDEFLTWPAPLCATAAAAGYRRHALFGPPVCLLSARRSCAPRPPSFALSLPRAARKTMLAPPVSLNHSRADGHAGGRMLDRSPTDRAGSSRARDREPARAWWTGQHIAATDIGPSQRPIETFEPFTWAASRSLRRQEKPAASNDRAVGCRLLRPGRRTGVARDVR